MNRLIALALLPLLAGTLNACGSSREDELMRRVAEADEAALRAEDAAKRAEIAASKFEAKITSSSNSEDETVAAPTSNPSPSPTVVVDGESDETPYGKGTEPVPQG